jgi:hypothetical protein
MGSGDGVGELGSAGPEPTGDMAGTKMGRGTGVVLGGRTMEDGRLLDYLKLGA